MSALDETPRNGGAEHYTIPKRRRGRHRQQEARTALKWTERNDAEVVTENSAYRAVRAAGDGWHLEAAGEYLGTFADIAQAKTAAAEHMAALKPAKAEPKAAGSGATKKA